MDGDQQKRRKLNDAICMATGSLILVSAVLLLSSTGSSRPTNGNNQTADDDDSLPTVNYRNRPRKSRICYDHARAKLCIMKDYLNPGPEKPTFQDKGFISQFRVSRRRFQLIMERIVPNNQKFYTSSLDAFGKAGICIEGKIMIALKSLAYGAPASAWRDYFQMSMAASDQCVIQFTKTVVETYREEYLRLPTSRDVNSILKLHESRHSIKGMLGSLDCMHLVWKNCPMAWQGTHKGKEKKPTLVLEAACDYNLWIWHYFFGCPGAMNDINVLHQSPLYHAFINGSFDKLDQPFHIGGHLFKRLYYLVDGIYPQLTRFVKTISAPINSDEQNFCLWQESARKDIERCFGVLQCRFQVLAVPVMAHKLAHIHSTVECCIILHNILVQDRINGVESRKYVPAEGRRRLTTETSETITNYAEDQLRRRAVMNGDACSVIGSRCGQSIHRAQNEQQWGSVLDRAEHLRLQRAIMNAVSSRK